MSEFPKTLAAARAVERSQWALGDALNEECINGRTIAEAATYLTEHGLDAGHFCESYLEELRRTARNFPEDRRRPSLSFSAHEAATTPEIFESAVKHIEARGEKPTRDRVREEARNIRGLPPRPERCPELASPRVFSEGETWLFISASIDKATSALEGAKEAIEDGITELDQSSISALIEQLIGVSEQAREIVDGLRRHSRDPRGHLSAIIGGAA